MLHSLTIHNVVIIDHLHLDFRSGFSVLTGETGAGKSILLQALSLVLGERAPSGFVRCPDKEASITASFSLDPDSPLLSTLQDQGWTPVDTLIIRRLLTADGKSRAFMNEQPVTLGFLKTIASQLVEIHGQFDHLLEISTHQETLDTYGHLQEPLALTAQFFKAWKESSQKLEALQKSLKDSEERLEFLDFSLTELEHLNPHPQEEETLLEKRQLLMGFEKRATTLKSIREALTEPLSVETSLRTAYRPLTKLTQNRDLFQNLETSLENAINVTQEMMEHLSQLEFDFAQESQDSLEDVENRLSALRSMARKHGKTPEELPVLLEDFREEKLLLKRGSEEILLLEKEAILHKNSYEKAATALRTHREESALTLSTKVQEQLHPLKLPHVTFEVHFHDLAESQWTSQGKERLEFWVSTNLGLVPGPLKNVASGGELSRIMLALKVILKEQKRVPTLIFDEIDTGLGGAVASAMGERLKTLSKNTQLFAITHSPQLAAHAHHHWHVEKMQTEGSTQTKVMSLTSLENRLEEIARMLSGKHITPEARAAAFELMKGAQDAP
jgi:DNA repair protein RecN (Recombination protein N)